MNIKEKELYKIAMKLKKLKNKQKNLKEADKCKNIRVLNEVYDLLPTHPHTKFPYYLKETELMLECLMKERLFNYALILDVKSLKKVNEIEGFKNHIHGDYYLKVVGELIREFFRDKDAKFSMFGGDEIIILMNSDLEEEKFKKIIEKRIKELNKKIKERMEDYFINQGIKRRIRKLGVHYVLVKLDDNYCNINQLREIYLKTKL